jgi:hypothetical protein
VKTCLLVLALIYQACGVMDPCGNEVVSRVPSPSGKYDAIVFERSCGATTGWLTHVAVVRGQATFREESAWWVATQSGKALVINDRTARRGVEGTNVTAQWVDDAHLTLKYDAGAAVVGGAPVVNGVEVQRRPLTPSH